VRGTTGREQSSPHAIPVTPHVIWASTPTATAPTVTSCSPLTIGNTRPTTVNSPQRTVAARTSASSTRRSEPAVTIVTARWVGVCALTTVTVSQTRHTNSVSEQAA
jgi:hypothetical protein